MYVNFCWEVSKMNIISFTDIIKNRVRRLVWRLLTFTKADKRFLKKMLGPKEIFLGSQASRNAFGSNYKSRKIGHQKHLLCFCSNFTNITHKSRVLYCCECQLSQSHFFFPFLYVSSPPHLRLLGAVYLYSYKAWQWQPFHLYESKAMYPHQQ